MQQLSNTADFAHLVRSRRLELGLSQALLASQIGVSRQWIIDIEKGKPRAELALALAVLEALDIQLSCKMNKSVKQKSVDSEQAEEKMRALADALSFL